jgi:D-beta-D-heptose 7-phosphate kinase/D-beta-D-heptose 1-phosphate adenosyltransferase
MASRKGKGPLRRLESLLADFARTRLLVVGDVVLDEYLWGEVDRVSPEAPVPVVHVRDESVVLGGAGNVVRNALALGARCDFCSLVGDDLDGERVRQLLKELGVSTQGIVQEEGRPTTRKTRVVARAQQMLRFDRESLEPPPAKLAKRIFEAVDEALAKADAVVFEDYGKGMLTPALVRKIMRRVEALGLPAAVDPKSELRAFRGARLLKPNLREAEDLTGVRVRGEADLPELASRLRRQVGPLDLVVTRGGDGMTIFEADAPGVTVSTVRREVFDVQGAGDTIIATLSLARHAGASLYEAAILANAAAGVVVGKSGTATASADEIRALLPEAIAAAEETS